MKGRLVKYINVIQLALIASLVSSSVSASAIDEIQQSIATASKAEAVPDSRSVVVFSSSGEAVFITDNPRFVVKGTVYDMWANEAVSSRAELKQASKTMPLDKIKLDKSNLFELVLNPTKSKTLTVFIDPFDQKAANQIDIITKYASAYRVKFIFTTLQANEASIAQLLKLGCVVQDEQPGNVVNALLTDKHRILDSQSFCLKESVVKTFAFGQFLNIHTLPTLIASNSVYSADMPQPFVAWLAKNME